MQEAALEENLIWFHKIHSNFENSWHHGVQEGVCSSAVAQHLDFCNSMTLWQSHHQQTFFEGKTLAELFGVEHWWYNGFFKAGRGEEWRVRGNKKVTK